jgi:D-alanyl-lipoteichoic acid acyltransferase DltB (MBOAT superfamily)
MNLFDGNMQFYSLEFLLFLFIAFSLFYLTKKDLRYIVLLLLSYIFYSVFNIKHLPVLLFVTVLNFLGAKYVDKIVDDKKRKYFFLLVLLLNLIILFFFKYLSFAIENINFLLGHLNIGFQIQDYSFALPLGLSFYIFATLGYVIDVYRRNSLPAKSFLKFGTFSSFFPLVQSGPIERSSNLLKQLNNEKLFNYENGRRGLYLILGGLIKKYLIADRLALIANPIFDDINHYNSLFIIIAVITFAFQIYYDFSGYSDIAIGIGSLFGFDIKRNFNYPYTAKSISEFWKKWHISLSEWMRDYIFLPVAYYTVKRSQNIKLLKPENISYYSAVFITMLITGIWHGASWNYIVWGLIFAFVMMFSQMTKKVRKKAFKMFHLIEYKRSLNTIKILNTFIIVCFAWIFFRTESIDEAIDLIIRIFNADILDIKLFTGNYDLIILKVPELTIIIGYLFLFTFEIVQLLERKFELLSRFYEINVYFRWTAYIILISLVFFFAVTGDTKFLYFKY